jgi:hypothetical protein
VKIAVVQVGECPRAGYARVLVFTLDTDTVDLAQSAHTLAEGFVDRRALPVLAAIVNAVGPLGGVPVRWRGELVDPVELPWAARRLLKHLPRA